MKNLFHAGLFVSLMIPAVLSAQDAEGRDNASKPKEDTVKTGFVLSPVPAVAYDSDIGFLYGIILHLYNYGDGSRYPRYDHDIYFEWSNTTKGAMKTILRYDSDRLIPGLRTSAELNYTIEKTMDFYGFNGYEALFDRRFIDDTDTENYKSRLFYNMDRRIFLSRFDITGNIIEPRLKWFAGIEYRHIQLDTLDTPRFNKGKSEGKQLPYDGGGLWGRYAYQWNVLPAGEVNFGRNTILKAGLIYDSRDNEPNPMRGLWSDAVLLFSPSFLGNTDKSYARLVLTHRQYFTLIPEDLNFVYRLSYQAKIAGDMPYYMLPFFFNSPPSWTRDGMGGSKTMRGILRNRVVGEDYFLGNLELRWKFWHFIVLNHNFYMALSGFLDGGMVTGKYDIDISGVPADQLYFFPDEQEKLHLAAGGGLHIAWNRNFIVAVDYGRALDPRDGVSGLYIGLDFLF